jgi:hypothetical protein
MKCTETSDDQKHHLQIGCKRWLQGNAVCEGRSVQENTVCGGGDCVFMRVVRVSAHRKVVRGTLILNMKTVTVVGLNAQKCARNSEDCCGCSRSTAENTPTAMDTTRFNCGG